MIQDYEVTLRACKEKEQQLQAELDRTKHLTQAKDQKISGLQVELQMKQKRIFSLSDQLENQKRELEMQQKGKIQLTLA